MTISRPTNIQKPFADAGAKNAIPVESTGTGKASFTDGFPPPTMRPITAGGIPPEGKDFNGILYDITSHTLWVNAGGQYQFDATLATAIGGYPAGMVIQDNAGVASYVSAVNNNTIDFNSTPSSIGVQWIPYGGPAFANITIATTGGNTTLTAVQSMAQFITITGTLVADATITVPAKLGRWTVINNTTGAFAVTVLPLGGSGVPVFQGKASTLYGDGAGIVDYDLHSSQTRPLFDSTKHLATTEFVQQALATIAIPPLPFLNRAIILASGNFTVPNGIGKIKAYAIGQGAPGTTGGDGLQNLVASGGYGGAGGAGGAGGGAAWGEINVTPGQVISCTITSSNTLFGPYLTATAGVGWTTPGTGSVGTGVTNSGTATGGQGGLGGYAGFSNQLYPLSGGGGGGGASGSPLGVGKNGANGGVNQHPTYRGFGGGGGGWNTDGAAGSGGNATSIYRGAFNQYSDLLLQPCASIVAGEDGAPLGYGGGGGWIGGGGPGGSSNAGSGGNVSAGSPGTIGGYGGGGSGGSGASMDGTTSGATKTGLAGGAGGPGCIVVFW